MAEVGDEMTASEAQARAFFREYCDIDDQDERWAHVVLRFGHPPSQAHWETLETMRTAHRVMQKGKGMTSGDIAALTGLKRETIRRMSKRGEIPAPVYRGDLIETNKIKWWWWDRAEIESWWERRQRAEEETVHS